MAEPIKLGLIQRANFMTDTPEQIKQNIQGLRASGEISLSALEKSTGYSSTTWSQYFSGSYEGNLAALDQSIARFYQLWMTKNTFIETKTAEQIHGFLELVWKRKRIAIIRGHYGVGKSKAVSRYAAENSEYTVVIEVRGVSSVGSLLKRIGESLGIRDVMMGSREDKLGSIIRALQRKPRLLVIEEADELHARTLKLLRDIHGDDEARSGIALVATSRLDETLRDPVLGYFRRRIKMTLDVDDMAVEEASKIVGLWPHNLDKPELKKLWDWARAHFGIGSLVNLMDVAYDLMIYEGSKKINADLIETALGYMYTPARGRN